MLTCALQILEGRINRQPFILPPPPLPPLLFTHSRTCAAHPTTSHSKMVATAPAHPTYAAMVSQALTSLKERSGSSLPAIKKFIGATFKGLPANWEKVLSVQLRKLALAGKLVRVKASYKLGEALKKPAKKVRPRSSTRCRGQQQHRGSRMGGC